MSKSEINMSAAAALARYGILIAAGREAEADAFWEQWRTANV